MNEWILKLIGMVVGSASPELRKALEEWIGTLEVKAKATANPWDDILVGLLKTVLLVKTK